ncbi:hypothetical protein OPV22_009709 [Ensete ventricosum]|uniref:Uncharacterized protein n=1 Tax=Ensete ventricosum TaxID=4639 RepID=A0AAV8RJP5_ENSVE|nr:hypothetical protein OPV22_009709 [Ensete ventricosum]RWV85357.1 hypothetical protein GW17_00052861 [Ensete ventricosum]RWW37291.1 hypothetical protein BHE74_00057624 [Ensete ventricosum]RZS27932.1 hypothetical protein BHM03_00061475 [Ensete ventricosum]
MEGTLHLAPVYPPSTATELAAAELLVQLSGSSASFSSSPGSGNAKRQRPEIKILPENEETGPWQRTRRYRPIALLYASTRPLHDRDRDNKRRTMDS